MPLWNFALTRTQSFQMQSTGRVNKAAPRHALPRRRSVDVLNLADVLGQPVQGQPGLGRQPDEQAVLYSTMKIRAANHNRPVGSINHTSWITPDAKAQPLLTLERQEWEAAVPQPTRVHKFDVPWLKESGVDRWVDVVVNNFDDRGHPFHLVRIDPDPFRNLTADHLSNNSSSDSTAMSSLSWHKPGGLECTEGITPLTRRVWPTRRP